MMTLLVEGEGMAEHLNDSGDRLKRTESVVHCEEEEEVMMTWTIVSLSRYL